MVPFPSGCWTRLALWKFEILSISVADSPIDAIIFDWGGVITIPPGPVVTRLYGESGVNQNALKHFLNGPAVMPYNGLHMLLKSDSLQSFSGWMMISSLMPLETHNSPLLLNFVPQTPGPTQPCPPPPIPHTPSPITTQVWAYDAQGNRIKRLNLPGKEEGDGEGRDGVEAEALAAHTRRCASQAASA